MPWGRALVSAIESSAAEVRVVNACFLKCIA
jgi:hypothetical protein